MQAGTVSNNNNGEDEDLDIDAFFLPGGILDPEANNAAAQEHTALPPSSAAEGPTGGAYEKAPSSYGSADLATILPIFASKSSPLPSNPWNADTSKAEEDETITGAPLVPNAGDNSNAGEDKLSSWLQSSMTRTDQAVGNKNENSSLEMLQSSVGPASSLQLDAATTLPPPPLPDLVPPVLPKPPPGFESMPNNEPPSENRTARANTNESWFSTKSQDIPAHMDGGGDDDRVGTRETTIRTVAEPKDGASELLLEKPDTTSAPLNRILSFSGKEALETEPIGPTGGDAQEDELAKAKEESVLEPNPSKSETSHRPNELQADDSSTKADSGKETTPAKILPESSSSKSSRRKRKTKSATTGGATTGKSAPPESGSSETGDVKDGILPTDDVLPDSSNAHSHDPQAPPPPPPQERQESLLQAVFNVFAAMLNCVFQTSPARAISLVVDVYRALIDPMVQSALGAVVFVAKYVFIFSVAVGNIFKFALEEAALGHYVSDLMLMWNPTLQPHGRQASVSFLCYLVLYLIPYVSDILMAHLDLPHYTPHIISNAALYSLSLRLSHLASSTEAANRVARRGKASNSNNHDSANTNTAVAAKSSSSQQQHLNNYYIPESDRRRLEHDLCQRILRSLRFAIPGSFLMEGFSNANASFAMAEAPVRLTIAYFLSLTKHGSVLSPVAWVGWSTQVLLAAYLPSGYLLDVVLLVVGLAFVRLVSTLHYE